MITLLFGLGVYSVLLDLAVLGLLFACTETETFPLAALVLFLLIPGVLYFFCSINLYAMAWANIGAVLLGAAGYLGVGVLYSFVKWFLFVRSKQDEVKANWDDFQSRIMKSFYKDTVPTDPGYADIVAKTRNEFINSSTHNPIYRRGVSLSDKNNWKILNWILLWPFSMVWNVARGLTIDIGKTMLRLFGSVYDRATKKTYDSLK